MDFITCLDGHGAVRQLGTEAAYWVPWRGSKVVNFCENHEKNMKKPWKSGKKRGFHSFFLFQDLNRISLDLSGFNRIERDAMGFVSVYIGVHDGISEGINGDLTD